MKTVGVSQASVWICPLGRAGDSGRDTFTKKKKKQMKSKQKELNEYPGSSLDPPIGSDRKGVLHIELTKLTQNFPYGTIKDQYLP